VTRKMFEINSPRNQREVMAVEYEKHDSLRNIEWVDAKCITYTCFWKSCVCSFS
jgi:hypothetical protein